LNCLYDWDSDYLLIGAEVTPGIFLNKKTFAFSYWPGITGKLGPAHSTASPHVPMNYIQHIEVKDVNTIYFSVLLNGELYEADKRSGEIKALHRNSADVLSIGQFAVVNHNYLDDRLEPRFVCSK